MVLFVFRNIADIGAGWHHVIIVYGSPTRVFLDGNEIYSVDDYEISDTNVEMLTQESCHGTVLYILLVLLVIFYNLLLL